MKDNVSVEEAAQRLHVRRSAIRAGLISKEFDFGRAVKGVKNYSYIIPRERFEMWISGEDLKPIIKILNQKADNTANPS